MEELVKRLRESGVLRSPQIIEAFLAIDRADFVPEGSGEGAYIDEALSIGYGQTISQPYTVAFMLGLLEPQAGETILDIGSGSGWQTVMLANIVGGAGRVYAIEIVPELCELGKRNARKYNFVEKSIVEFHCGDGDKPVVGAGAADRIIAAASIACDEPDKSKCLPENWKRQLKIGGVIVTPIGQSIWKFIKKSEDEFISEEYPGFVFVPYV